MEKATYTAAHFSPKDVEGITELSTTMQRDWRRRGFIETQNGHAKFDPFEVATIWIAKTLADRGIGPTVSKVIAPICGVGLVVYPSSGRGSVVYSSSFVSGFSSSVLGSVVCSSGPSPEVWSSGFVPGFC